MRILQSWLQRYITFAIPPQELVERLTMLGLEFESVEHLGAGLKGVVVGKVLECTMHPRADRLTVCRVDTGKATLQVVCGAPNVATGQKVAVGLVGATIPHDQHDPGGAPFTLRQVSIRGVESSGMICSSYELGLGDDAEGILVLDPGAVVGQPLADHLGMDDVAYDVEITPNRPDWLSHLGVAREIGVLIGRRPKVPAVRVKEGTVPIRRHLSVTVEATEECPRFAARMIRGVTIGPSPDWMQRLLRNAGLRPKNNVVDVTNFVMLECGQPMHAFDYALLHGRAIIVRTAGADKTFRTLDGREHMLPGDAVMVCDAEREVSIAGVMGGENSEINDRTVDIVLESAYWKPSSIRRTSKQLGVISDASQRFERGADPGAVRYALDRAAALVVATAGGQVLKGVIDVYPKKIPEARIGLRPARVNAVLGTELRESEIVRCLRLLDIHQTGQRGPSLVFRVPTYRVDVTREIDLIEEVARVHGYDRIEAKTTAVIDFSAPSKSRSVADDVRAAVIGAGFQEAITNSMLDRDRAALPDREPVQILNPLSQDMAYMRTSLLPGLLDCVGRNINNGNASLRLFEIGHVFRIDRSDKPKLVGDFSEEEKIALVATGTAFPRHWSQPVRMVDLYDMKGMVHDLLAKFALDKFNFISYPTSDGLTDDTLVVEIEGSYVASLGRARRDALRRADIEQEVYVAEISLTALQGESGKRYRPVARFPRVRRDVAFVVNVDVAAEAVETVIRQSAGELLQNAELFDVYEGDGLPAGKKSLAFSLELMSERKTLTDAEIEGVMRNVVAQVEEAFDATLRSVK